MLKAWKTLKIKLKVKPKEPVGTKWVPTVSQIMTKMYQHMDVFSMSVLETGNRPTEEVPKSITFTENQDKITKKGVQKCVLKKHDFGMNC